jgi:lysozyme family protein
MQPLKFITGNLKSFITPLQAKKDKRKLLFDTMVVKNPYVQAGLNNKVANILDHKERYEFIAHKFINPGLRWYHIGIFHDLECEQNFLKYLGNGQSLKHRTTIVPKGRGPFASFEAGAIDAIKIQGIDNIQDWSIGGALYTIETFNGLGYEKYHNMNSPYLFAGTQHYTKGKYDKDGHFNPELVSSQIGAALLLRELLKVA